MESLQYIIYISTPSSDVDRNELLSIWDTSLKNNAETGITGILLHRGSYFVQYIEGEPSHIDDLLVKISDDPRHKDLIVLDGGLGHKRLFPDWTMCTDEALLRMTLLSLDKTITKDDEHFLPIRILAGFFRNEGYVENLKKKG